MRYDLFGAPGGHGSFEVLPDGRLVGWRASRYDPRTREAVSGADSRQRWRLVRGAMTRLRPPGLFLAATRAYVLDYYGDHPHGVVMRYAFRPQDVTRGNLTDREPEIAVREAELLDFETYEGEE